ncbi:PREDICTED: nuclear pore glycoprotein p62-like isoform X2 [Myotis brandtii]|uniref:nuclear pore glycoprotein p62-like isoform X2 n=1 Tax=Myotis brandtii TaxID=109478 RepID=UPI000704508E|nr:PREDICTED: nuclear pore glycoprotein p62-like isoform X2 [Myotis brandtii]
MSKGKKPYYPLHDPTILAATFGGITLGFGLIFPGMGGAASTIPSTTTTTTTTNTTTTTSEFTFSRKPLIATGIKYTLPVSLASIPLTSTLK